MWWFVDAPHGGVPQGWGLEAVFVIKSSPKLVPVTHIRTNMRTAGMSRERYFQLLEKLK